MSIYATLWEMKIRRRHAFDDEWIRVYAQAVPAHIGHPSEYPKGDPYSGFLPPVVDYDPDNWEADQIERAVVIVVEGREQKDEQRYVDPLLTLTGHEYRSMSFRELMRLIEEKLWDSSVIGCTIDSDGTKTIVRRP